MCAQGSSSEIALKMRKRVGFLFSQHRIAKIQKLGVRRSHRLFFVFSAARTTKTSSSEKKRFQSKQMSRFDPVIACMMYVGLINRNLN